jgi:hypothetical protein
VLLREVEDYPGEVDCLVVVLSQVAVEDCPGEEDYPGVVVAEWDLALDLASVCHQTQLVMC